MQESKPSNHIYTYSMWSYFAAAQKNSMNSVLLSCSDIIRTSINVIVQFPKYEINIVSFCSNINYIQSVFDHIHGYQSYKLLHIPQFWLTVETLLIAIDLIPIIRLQDLITSVFKNGLFVTHSLVCSFETLSLAINLIPII